MTPNALQEQRFNIWNQMQDLLKRAKNENRSLSADEHVTFGKMDTDLTSLKLQLDTEARARALSAEFEAKQDEVEIRKMESNKLTYEGAFGKYIRSGKMTDEGVELMKLEKRGTGTQVVGTDSLGGYLVAKTWADSIDSTMKQFGGMLDAAYVFNTGTGGDFNVPTEDNRTTVGAIIGENTADVVSDETFATKTMKAFVYTSKWIKATLEMLSDSNYPLENYINGRIAERIGRKLNTDFTVGAGTTEPFGVVTSSALGSTTAGVAAVTRLEILNLIHAVDPAYRKASKLMMNDTTLLALKKLTVGSGDDRPLWTPNNQYLDGKPDKIEGFDIIINQDMASMATGNKFMLFGDFSKYWIRKIWDINLVSSREKYIDSRAMGYFGYCRYDGLLINTGAVKHLKNA